MSFPFMRRIAAPLCLTGLLASACLAQDAAEFQPDDLRQDFRTLYAAMQEAHADIDAATPQAVLDQRHAEMLRGMNQAMTQAEAAITFQTFLAEIRHSHARIDFPVGAWNDWRESGGGALPIDIRVRDGRVWLFDHQTQDTRLARGDEVLALNGEPNAIWLNRMTRHLSAETPDMAYSLLESYLPALFWVEYPDAGTVSLRVRHADGTESDIVVPLVSRADMQALPERAPEGFTLPEFDSRILEGGIAYLRPGPFYNAEAGGNPWDPTGYIARIDAAFEDFLAQDATALIIDVRDNPGGTNSFSDPIIAWFATADWTIASDFRIRISEQTTASNQARLETLEAPEGSISAEYAALFANAENGEIISFDMPSASPRDGARFTAPVYLLINRYSYSNSANVAAILQDYGFATIAGETTTDMATTYGAMEHFTLPLTGIRVGFPKAHIIRPSGVEHPHPVTPDLELDFPALRGQSDVVLEQLRAHIAAHAH